MPGEYLHYDVISSWGKRFTAKNLLPPVMIQVPGHLARDKTHHLPKPNFPQMPVVFAAFCSYTNHSEGVETIIDIR